MTDTCLAKGCTAELPKWTKLCADHMWMASVVVAADSAVTDTFNGHYQNAIDELEVAIRKLREAQDG